MKMNDLNVPSNAVNVLIIDDEPQIRKFLDIALRAQGYKTFLAETGQMGLEMLALQVCIVTGKQIGRAHV